MNGDMNDMLRNEAEIFIIGIVVVLVVYIAVLMYVWWF